MVEAFKKDSGSMIPESIRENVVNHYYGWEPQRARPVTLRETLEYKNREDASLFGVTPLQGPHYPILEPHELNTMLRRDSLTLAILEQERVRAASVDVYMKHDDSMGKSQEAKVIDEQEEVKSGSRKGQFIVSKKIKMVKKMYSDVVEGKLAFGQLPNSPQV